MAGFWEDIMIKVGSKVRIKRDALVSSYAAVRGRDKQTIGVTRKNDLCGAWYVEFPYGNTGTLGKEASFYLELVSPSIKLLSKKRVSR